MVLETVAFDTQTSCASMVSAGLETAAFDTQTSCASICSHMYKMRRLPRDKSF